MGYRRIISTSKSILHAPNLIYLRIIKVNNQSMSILTGSRFLVFLQQQEESSRRRGQEKETGTDWNWRLGE